MKKLKMTGLASIFPDTPALFCSKFKNLKIHQNVVAVFFHVLADFLILFDCVCVYVCAQAYLCMLVWVWCVRLLNELQQIMQIQVMSVK